MNQKDLFVIAMCIIPGFGLAFLSQTKVNDLNLKEALDYQKLQPLHKGLRDMERESAMLCAPVGFSFGPHHKPGIRTYGNALASKGMKAPDKPKFAVGTVFVKEKFETKDAKKPSLITVMKKVYEGTGARSWQYMMVDLSTKKVLAFVDPKKLKDPSSDKCISCHDRYNAADGVSMFFTD